MITLKRYLLTLVALLAMTTGAWADGTLLTTITASSDFKSGSKTFDNVATVTFSGSVNYGGGWFYTVTSTPVTVTVSAANDDVIITSVKFFTTLGDVEDKESTYEAQLKAKNGFDPSIGAIQYYQVYVNGSIIGAENAENYLTKIEVYGTKKESGPKVTITEKDTKASFAMPAYDATVSYELVRDMTVDVGATIADRIRIKKENNDYVVVTDGQLIPAVSDKISGTAVAMTATTDYTAQLQKKTEGDTPTWADATTLSVGTFRYVITGAGLYDGEITTNEFQLFEGYEVTVGAGEYATFYKDENLYTEDENAELYTIASVSTTEAVLGEKMEVAPAETPLLVYNAGSETKTFLLIPTDDEASEVLVAAEFRGTLAAKDMPASSSTMDYYVCTGKAFTWVRDAGQIAANRCWLQIGSGNQPAATRASSRTITRGFGGIDGTTGIDAIDNEQFANDTYYDLQGRKVQNPKRGGIYIHNGKKVIVR